MRIIEILEANNNRRNKMLYFRQTIDSILQKIAGKTIVVFDTETTGLSVKLPWVQVTEIAAVAFDADTGKQLGKFHRKIHLTDVTKQEIQRQRKNIKEPSAPDAKDGDRGSLEGPRGANIDDLLAMTKYAEQNTEFGEIKQIYTDWIRWLNQFNEPVMLGQNAAFDMGQMFAPLKKLGLPRPKIGEVLDTMIVARTWIYPLLKAAEEAGDLESAEKAAGFTDPKSGKLTFRLGTLGKVFNVPAEHWHSGISDALQTYGIFNKMIQFLKSAKAAGYEDSDAFKKLHAKMSGQAFTYGKRPAFQSTIDSDTAKGIKARGKPRIDL